MAILLNIHKFYANHTYKLKDNNIWILFNFKYFINISYHFLSLLFLLLYIIYRTYIIFFFSPQLDVK